VYTAVADLRSAADQRPALVQRARGLSTDLLSHDGELQAELIAAIDHRRLADEAYAGWAEAVERTGCGSPAMLGPQRRSGETEAQAAAAAGRRLAQLWNPIADRYGHPRLSNQDI
jgi:hypothetical protein